MSVGKQCVVAECRSAATVAIFAARKISGKRVSNSPEALVCDNPLHRQQAKDSIRRLGLIPHSQTLNTDIRPERTEAMTRTLKIELHIPIFGNDFQARQTASRILQYLKVEVDTRIFGYIHEGSTKFNISDSYQTAPVPGNGEKPNIEEK